MYNIYIYIYTYIYIYIISSQHVYCINTIKYSAVP